MSIGTLALEGNLIVTPLEAGWGVSTTPVFFSEALAVARKIYDEIWLSDNTTINIAFGGLSEVNVLFIQAVGGKVKLRVTSTDGSQQALPVDPIQLLVSKSVGITALDITRDSTVTNTVKVAVFLAQKQ